MYNYQTGSPFAFIGHFFLIIMVLALWSIFWKGLAFWHSARRADTVWFILFLFLNTAGILEIIYLFGFAKKKFGDLFSK